MIDIPTGILLPVRKSIDTFHLVWAVILVALGIPLGILALFLRPSKAKERAAAACGAFACVAAGIVWPF